LKGREDSHLTVSVAALTSAHLAWLELRRQPSTVDFYRFAHRRLGEFAAQGAVPPRLDRWKPLVADQYAKWLQGTGVKAVTVRHYVSALVTLCRWAVGQDYLARNPLQGYVLPAGKAAMVTGYRPEEVARMLDACGRTPLGLRNRALLLFLYDTGVRASECAALTIGDVDLVQGTALVRAGKGDKPRLVCFGDITSQALRRYVVRYHPAGEDPAAPLLPGRGGRPMSRYGVSHAVDALAAAAGLDTSVRLGAHRLRHAFAESMLVHGSNTRAVQDLLGHADQDTVVRYTQFLASDLMAQHRRSSPVAHVDAPTASPTSSRKRR
jgi:site-specific recombinase XerD